MNIIELYRDYGLQFVTEGHKHCQEGWVNVICPFCTGNPGYHLGFNTYDNYFHCWRCGGKSTYLTIAHLLNVSESKAKQLVREYGGLKTFTPAPEPKIKIPRKSFKLPSLTNFTSRHISYVQQKRGFNARELIKIWDLRATGVISKLDDIDYKFRILAPIYWAGKMVSFQTRDITGKSQLKYKACPKDRETIHHKYILYGKQEFWKETGICVEGIVDVWRLGVKSFATFGIQYTPHQVREISRRFKRVAIIFDPDPQAVEQAKSLKADLCFRGVDAFCIFTKKDPGDMDQKEADYLVQQIIKNQ